MSELIKNTEILVDRFNDEVRADLRGKGIDNTGEASNSIRRETKVSGTVISVKSLGIDYMYYLDKGRAPGKFPPKNVLEEWAASKPVDINPYLIGRKIAREGTEIFKNPTKGIQLDEKRAELGKQLKELAPKWAKQDLLIKLKTNNKFK